MHNRTDNVSPLQHIHASKQNINKILNPFVVQHRTTFLTKIPKQLINVTRISKNIPRNFRIRIFFMGRVDRELPNAIVAGAVNLRYPCINLPHLAPLHNSHTHGVRHTYRKMMRLITHTVYDTYRKMMKLIIHTVYDTYSKMMKLTLHTVYDTYSKMLKLIIHTVYGKRTVR